MRDRGETAPSPEQPLGDVLHEAKRDLDGAQRLGGSLSWTIGDKLAAVWDALAGSLPPAQARKQYRAFLDSLEHPLSPGQASRLKTFAQLRSEAARTLPAYKGYYAARAVLEGRLTEREAVELAHGLSVHDFQAAVWPDEKGAAVKERACPVDGRPCPRAAKAGAV